MLPVGIPDAHGSPYSSVSARAGSPYLISLEALAEWGLLTREELRPPAGAGTGRVRFAIVNHFREQRLRQAWARFSDRRAGGEFAQFCDMQSGWLDDFALFSVLKEIHGQRPWTDWKPELRAHRPAALERMAERYASEMDFFRFVQFLFHRQWDALRRYAHSKGIGLIGDVPIFVSHDSVDVWRNQELFELDRSGRPRRVSGVPPDIFSRTGQLWGHPQFNWPAHERSGFAWWVERLGASFELFDAMRIDHFLGFWRVWSVPAKHRTAQRGRWVNSPGEALFAAFERAHGARPIIAEDLGLLTPEAARLRDALGMPGMRVLQFGFGPGGGDAYNQPHSFVRHSVVYTGTHDNPTTAGWFKSLGAAGRRAFLTYAGAASDRSPHRAMIRLAMSSVSNTAIIPMQDLLGLDNRARMNRPGVTTGNWAWRLPEGALSRPLAHELKEMTELFHRAPDQRSG